MSLRSNLFICLVAFSYCNKAEVCGKSVWILWSLDIKLIQCIYICADNHERDEESWQWFPSLLHLGWPLGVFRGMECIWSRSSSGFKSEWLCCPVLCAIFVWDSTLYRPFKALHQAKVSLLCALSAYLQMIKIVIIHAYWSLNEFMYNSLGDKESSVEEFPEDEFSIIW